MYFSISAVRPSVGTHARVHDMADWTGMKATSGIGVQRGTQRMTPSEPHPSEPQAARAREEAAGTTD